MNRIDEDKILELAENASLHELGRMSSDVRFEKHPGDIVTYVSDRNVNYTNICVSGCRFCAFRSMPDEDGGWLLMQHELNEKIREACDAGATQILLQGGLHPAKKIDFYEDMVSGIKSEFDIHLHGFSPPEIVHIASLSELSTNEVLKRLIDAGLDTIPGGGAEILVDSVRNRVSPEKCSADEWLRVMREAHNLGLKTSATMMFGIGEKIEDRIEHLWRIRQLQDETNGFTAFIPWTFQPQNTELSDLESPSGIEYLRMLAISRIFLDNIDNVQASWVTQGEKIGQLALFFGANDMGGTMMEENVVRAAGCENRLSESRLRVIIEKAGFVPKKRNTLYEIIEVGV
ncbi:MAG: cyclic dehypoxanthinyl futalosine synthase [bacterium]